MITLCEGCGAPGSGVVTPGSSKSESLCCSPELKDPPPVLVAESSSLSESALMVLSTPSNVVSNKESAKPASSGGTGVGGCCRTVG